MPDSDLLFRLMSWLNSEGFPTTHISEVDMSGEHLRVRVMPEREPAFLSLPTICSLSDKGMMVAKLEETDKDGCPIYTIQ